MMDASLAGAHRIGHPRLLAEIHTDHMFARHWGGRTREADAAIEALPALLAGMDDPNLDARVYFRLGLVYRDRGRSHQALECSSIAAQRFLDAGDPVGAAIVQAYHGHALITLGRHDEAARVGRAALEIAGSTSQWLPRFSGLLLLGRALIPSEPDSALEHLRQALGIAREFGHRHNELAVLSSMAAALRQTGRLTEAIALHRQTARVVTAVGEDQWALVHFGEAAETYLRAGQPAVSARLFRICLKIARERHLPGPQMVAHQGLAAALASTDPATAAEHTEAAAALARELAA